MRKYRSRHPVMFVGPLSVFAAAVSLWGSGFLNRALVPSTVGPDREGAHFIVCPGPVRIDCVVDGDTFWYHGEKVRIADINTPETSNPSCRSEAELGARATERLTQLLNAGPFSLASSDRDRDSYGRALRLVTRRGESLGAVLEAEGLAEHWHGYRRDWC